MKRTGRWRKWAKWAGVAACAVILAAWGVSVSYSMMVPLTERVTLFSHGGGIDFWIFNHPHGWTSDTKWNAIGPSYRRIGFRWPYCGPFPDLGHAGFPDSLLVVPYWILFLLAGVPTALLFFLDRRKIVPGCCKQCGYDLRTISNGRCPECGTAAAAEGVS